MRLKKCFAVVLVALVSHSSHGVNVLKANTEFKKGNHTQALSLYEEGAKLGNAHAQYQLGVMYSKGLGAEPSVVSSMIYFSLAAEKGYQCTVYCRKDEIVFRRSGAFTYYESNRRRKSCSY